MSTIRKLSAFRQLSLNSTPEQRRKTLKKQYSEDLPDIRDAWLDPGGIKISVNSKYRPLPIKIAWEENSDLKTEEAVIIKKCKEVRRASTGKLSRQSSLEKDSILHSKQEIAERLRQHVKENKEKEQEKMNLKIFLAQNSVEQKDAFFGAQSEKEPPKLIQPLLSNNTRSNSHNLFKIHRNRHKIDLHEIAYSPTRSKDAIHRNDTVVVVPIIEKIDTNEVKHFKEEIRPIDSIIIRPATAASKREKFQKRSNSAFSATVDDSLSRPTLVRSSSAMARPERGKSKFVATKRKIRSAKRPVTKSVPRNEESEGGVADIPVAVSAAEIVTMVSLVSPAGSDAEEEVAQEEKEKCKTKGSGAKTKEETEVQKNMSLRKTVKSVSFQQSSIHAVRSFSASFPARRGSMATAIMLGKNAMKVPPQGPKVQEKRSTNPSAVDDDERVPKRRLVRSQTENEIDSCEPPDEVSTSSQLTDDEEKPTTNVNFTVDIKTKDVPETPEIPDAEGATTAESPTETSGETPTKTKKEVKYESPKERQCWELHRKMTEKGINVSLDTILRGMLTPTEYRLSRQNSIVAAEVAAIEASTEDATS